MDKLTKKINSLLYLIKTTIFNSFVKANLKYSSFFAKRTGLGELFVGDIGIKVGRCQCWQDGNFRDYINAQMDSKQRMKIIQG
jgi:hypothetical protein